MGVGGRLTGPRGEEGLGAQSDNSYCMLGQGHSRVGGSRWCGCNGGPLGAERRVMGREQV